MKIYLSFDHIIEKYMKLALENYDVPFVYNETTIVNLKDFYEFITDRVKAKTINFEEYLKDLIDRAVIHEHYELMPYETKSGNAETIRFEVSYDYDEENDEISNYTITF